MSVHYSVQSCSYVIACYVVFSSIIVSTQLSGRILLVDVMTILC